MITTQTLSNEYSVNTPQSGTATLDFKLGDDYSNSNPTRFVIKDTDDLKESITVYSNGLAIYFKQDAKEIKMLTNGEFDLRDDGNFHLISF